MCRQTFSWRDEFSEFREIYREIGRLLHGHHSNMNMTKLPIMTRLEGAQSLECISSDVSRAQGRSFLSGCSLCEQKLRPTKILENENKQIKIPFVENVVRRNSLFFRDLNLFIYT